MGVWTFGFTPLAVFGRCRVDQDDQDCRNPPPDTADPAVKPTNTQKVAAVLGRTRSVAAVLAEREAAQ